MTTARGAWWGGEDGPTGPVAANILDCYATFMDVKCMLGYMGVRGAVYKGPAWGGCMRCAW